MSNDIAPKATLILNTEEQIKAYVHPTRINLLKMLAKSKRTISSIAKELGVHPANITHHFKLLEKSGLIKLVEKRDTGRNLEKYYRAVAFSYSVQADNETTNKKALALSILRDNLNIAVENMKSDQNDAENNDNKVIAILETAKLDPRRLRRFEKSLARLVKEFASKDSPDGTTYTISLALYPNDTNCKLGADKIEIK